MIEPRADLVLVAGYHSPQLDVEFRMNTNEAPEGPPQAFLEALETELASVALNRYPDLAATELRQAIARFHGVSASEVYCANGSNEVLQAVLLAYGGPGRVAVTFEPTYAMHSHIARITGTTVIEGERNEEFFVETDEFDAAIVRSRKFGEENPAVVFLCSPNNPTGRVEPTETVRAVLERAPGLVVVDEAYGQFAPISALELRAEFPNLVVIRTFSKTWSLAALRLGYAIASPAVVQALESVTLPYHLDAIKQLAGRIALDFEPEMRAHVARLVEERGRVIVGLRELPVKVCPSEANFILFRLEHHDARKVWDRLVEHSVLVRDVSSWDRLGGYLRVTIGTVHENDAFLAVLATALTSSS